MKRLQRIVVEIFAIIAIWMLWDFRMAATLFVLLCVFEAFRQDVPADRGSIPTLAEPLGSPKRP